MTKDTALRLALEALKNSWTEPNNEQYEIEKEAIVAIKAALEAKDEKANDELRRLHDLLGKANALARIRANKIDELEQRLTKTEAQLGEAVWNYGELKREQLANQQKTSGSPINTSTALEAKDEPDKYAMDIECTKCGATQSGVLTVHTTPPQRKPLTDEEVRKVARLFSNRVAEMCNVDADDHWKYHSEEVVDDVKFVLKAAHGIKGEA